MTGNGHQIRIKDSKSIITLLNNCWERTSTAFIVLFLFICLLFLGGLGRRHLWNADEPREAGITAEMARSGDFVVPRLNGSVFLEKPPLYYWISSIAFRVFGENTYTTRFTSALAAIGGVIISFFLARAMKMSISGAFMSGFVLATSAEYWSLGRTCLIDMTLCFFVTASMACFYQILHSASGKKLWFLVFALSMGGAILTKGLIGLAVPISAIVVCLIVEKDFSLKSRFALMVGFVLSFIPYAIWLLLLYNSQGKEAVYENFWVNNFGRFTGGYAQHVCPFYYYLTKFPAQFFPWTFFLPLGGYFLFRDTRKRDKSNPSVFILSWFIVPFVLLSISAGKRSIYLIPLYPAAALSVGYAMDLVLSRKEKLTGWFEIPASILAGIVVVTPLVFLGIRLYYHQPFVLMILITIVGFGLGLVAFRLFAKKEYNRFFQMLVFSFLLIFLIFDMAVMPIFNAKESFEPLFKYAEKLKSEGNTVCLLQPTERLDGAAVFYLGQQIVKFNDFNAAHEFMQKDDKAVIITRIENVEKITDITIIKNFNIGKDSVVIFTDKKLVRENNEYQIDSDNHYRDS
jgi:4-amino-4-deoxy-L-arabinose transferase-like glycosyltransferase